MEFFGAEHQRLTFSSIVGLYKAQKLKGYLLSP